MATSSSSLSAGQRQFVIETDKVILQIARHWLLVLNLIWVIYVGTPWLAPIFMELGWNQAGSAVYAIYSTQCHQLPERSFFLFGGKGFTMYSLPEIQRVWQNTTNPVILRQFIGNEMMGWKVAWSDRMVSLYGGVLLGGLVYALFRRRLPRLSLWAFVLFCVPMGFDGGTHFLSDLAGIGAGFRDSNAWLAMLTGNVFPAWFYAGDALGSFNSWMRLLTGLVFGLGAVWLALPYLEETMNDISVNLESKLCRADVLH